MDKIFVVDEVHHLMRKGRLHSIMRTSTIIACVAQSFSWNNK